MGFLSPQTPPTPAAPVPPPQVNQPQGTKPSPADAQPSFLGAALLPIQAATGQPGLTGNVPGKSSLGS